MKKKNSPFLHSTHQEWGFFFLELKLALVTTIEIQICPGVTYVSMSKSVWQVAINYANQRTYSSTLVWPQWWSFADVSQQGVDFSKKISKIKIFFWFDFHRCSHGPSKIRRHFRNKSRSILKLSKNVFYKKCGPRLIFFNENFFRKIWPFFDIEKWLWKSDLGTFRRPVWTSVKVKSKKYFYFTDFFTKTKPLLTHVRKTPPLRSH